MAVSEQISYPTTPPEIPDDRLSDSYDAVETYLIISDLALRE